MNDTTGRGMGVARPRLLMLGAGKGPLLLSGGRLLTEKTRDILLWVCWDGMGENRTVPPTADRGVKCARGIGACLIPTACYKGLLFAALPAGEKWDAISISYRHNLLVRPESLRFSLAVNATTGRATTSYTSLLPLDVYAALLVCERSAHVIPTCPRSATFSPRR